MLSLNMFALKYIPTTPSSIFFKLLTFNLQLCPTSVLILEIHAGVKYSGATCVRASAMATPSDRSESKNTNVYFKHIELNGMQQDIY